MNYGEQLVYWYLRLNGFFPLTNFVPHRESGEIDMLAIRLPYVSEDIGGNPDDWDPRFRDPWDIRLESEKVGIFAEVKSGHWSARDLARAGGDGRLNAGIKRSGMFPTEIANSVAERLRDRPVVRQHGFTVAKMFVGVAERQPANRLHLPLHKADKFIRDRMAKYPNEKFGDRTRFGGDLIQYLAWQNGGAV
jgi:hypothetical protein